MERAYLTIQNSSSIDLTCIPFKLFFFSLNKPFDILEIKRNTNIYNALFRIKWPKVQTKRRNI